MGKAFARLYLEDLINAYFEVPTLFYIQGGYSLEREFLCGIHSQAVLEIIARGLGREN